MFLRGLQSLAPTSRKKGKRKTTREGLNTCLNYKPEQLRKWLLDSVSLRTE
jgi:hypothetical protein